VSGALCHAADRPATIYNMEMGYATAMCLGIALGQPGQKVVALEGDGSMVAGLSVLTTIGRYPARNLVVVIVNNGVYASTGSGDVATAAGLRTNLAAVAADCGIDAGHVRTVTEPAEAEAGLREALTEPGPWVIIAVVEAADPGPRRLPTRDLVETSLALNQELARRRSPSAAG
jgi:thiamine pyrophosphate-dependent acetolactate synthase large subunit-like protein